MDKTAREGTSVADLNTDIRFIKGVGETRAKALEKLHIRTLGDLISYYPRRWEDRTKLFPIRDLPEGEYACCRAMLAQEPTAHRISGGQTVVKVRAVDEGGVLDITFFHQEYRKNALHPGETYIFYGKVEGGGVRRRMVNPLLEIAASLTLGAFMGFLLTKLETLFHSNTNRRNITIAFVFLTASLSMLEFRIGPVTLGFSSLLVCMMLGTVFCNLCPLSQDLMAAADNWTSPLFAVFFVISGAELELNVFADLAIVLVGGVYILFRSLGKYAGALASTRWTHCPPAVCKYLGITLLPQAGVALGMCITAQQLGPEGAMIRNIILFSVLIYELFGPMLTKQALTRAGDIQPMAEAVRNRRQTKLEHASAQRRP